MKVYILNRVLFLHIIFCPYNPHFKMIQISSGWLKLLHLWREDVCYFQSIIKLYWNLNDSFPSCSFFCGCLGSFEKKIACKEGRGCDFSQPMAVISACDRHRGMRTSCICLACNHSPNAQMNQEKMPTAQWILFHFEAFALHKSAY